MSVPFLDMAGLHASIPTELDVAYDRVLTTSAFVGGSEVAGFEEEFSASTANGTVVRNSAIDAVSPALRAPWVGPGNDVIMPSMTSVATRAWFPGRGSVSMSRSATSHGVRGRATPIEVDR